MYQPTNIHTVDQIHTNCTQIQAFIEAHYTSDNPTAVVDRANSLEAYMALSGKLLADAEWHYNSMVESSIMTALKGAIETKLSPSTLNKYVEAAARDYKYLVTWADRINRSTTHQLDMCRTLISKLKEEIRQLQYGKT